MAGKSDPRVAQTVILLLILGVAGGWNYHRNATIENAVPRPYRGYSDQELQQMISAYQGEVEIQMARYRKAGDANKVVVQGGGLLEERIDEFERAQRASRERRDRAYKVTDNQILVDQLAKEQMIRERDRPVYKMIFRRVTTF
ncbi:MAG: hypothetical protein JRF15_11670 [Deltaproteobacteria bacterium]|jgi:hypothetical protein|nr:hypothetical protein [Deltaproteobacteria bacterium]